MGLALDDRPSDDHCARVLARGGGAATTMGRDILRRCSSTHICSMFRMDCVLNGLWHGKYLPVLFHLENMDTIRSNVSVDIFGSFHIHMVRHSEQSRICTDSSLEHGEYWAWYRKVILTRFYFLHTHSSWDLRIHWFFRGLTRTEFIYCSKLLRWTGQRFKFENKFKLKRLRHHPYHHQNRRRTNYLLRWVKVEVQFMIRITIQVHQNLVIDTRWRVLRIISLNRW